MSQEHIAVVGAGLVGSAWAIAFARGGHRVSLFDPEPTAIQESQRRIASALADLQAHGLLAEALEAVLARVKPAPELRVAVEGAAYVQESAPEVLMAKQAVTAEICDMTGPETVIASSSSGFVPSAYCAEAKGRERCLVAHPINPPYLLPAVELVPAPWTDPAIVSRARSLLEGIGQVPVVMKKEIDSFVLNRLQGALLHEAFRLVAGGYISGADLDKAMVYGLAPRWAVIGPFETIDLNAPGGIRDCVARYGPMYDGLAKSQATPCDWQATLEDGLAAEREAALPRAEIPLRQAWRDRQLMALMRLRQETTRDIEQQD